MTNDASGFGQLWSLVQAYLDRQTFSVSERQLAARLGYASSSTFDNWRRPKSLPHPQALVRFAVLSGTPYQRVLDAALADAGYLPEPAVDTLPLRHIRAKSDIAFSDNLTILIGPDPDLRTEAEIAAEVAEEEASNRHYAEQDAARETGRTSRGQERRSRSDAAGDPEADDPDDLEPR